MVAVDDPAPSAFVSLARGHRRRNVTPVRAAGQPSGDTSRIDVDVLVVGGGVMGLSIAHELRLRGVESVILVASAPLGGGETVHSHGYLMRGYALPPEAPLALAKTLAHAFVWWSGFLDGAAPGDAKRPTWLGTEDAQVERRLREVGLPFRHEPVPPAALAGGHYARRGRLYRTEERLFVGADVVAALASRCAGHLARGELVGLHRDPVGRRIESCDVRVSDRTVRFRPTFVVLAAGRDNQRLLGGAASVAEPHVIRDVPMILLRGHALPEVAGFFLDAKLSIATHVAEDGERIWVVTPLGGHATSREDFDSAREAPLDPGLVRDALARLEAVVPATRALLDSGDVRVGAYCGPKLDHPTGALAPVIGDAGLENLRHVCPVVLSLAMPAAREVLRQLEATDGWARVARERRPLEARAHALPGVDVAVEQRLSREQRWYEPAEFRRVLVGAAAKRPG